MTTECSDGTSYPGVGGAGDTGRTADDLGYCSTIDLGESCDPEYGRVPLFVLSGCYVAKFFVVQ